MEKKIDAVIATSLTKLIEFMNKECITKDDIVQVFCASNDQYVAIIYK